MAHLENLNKADQVKWEQTKREMTVDREKGIFKGETSLGSCHVGMGVVDGQLYLEIMPNETSSLNENTEGVVVQVDENDVSLTGLMSMVSNERELTQAKIDGEPTIIFN